MTYFHKNIEQVKIDLPLGKIVCIGRNYAAHAKELGNKVPDIKSPLFFMKPKTALADLESPFSIPANQGEVHFETEIAVLLQKSLKDANEQEVEEAIWGYGIAFDLTLRDLQAELKQKSQPWEKAKAFDGACPVSSFVEKENFSLSEMTLESFKNKNKVQHANTSNMLWSIPKLISLMSECFTLEAGDIILTGTPEGVGPLQSKDQWHFLLKDGLKAGLENESKAILEFSSSVL